MAKRVSEAKLEEAIEAALTRGFGEEEVVAEAQVGYGNAIPGGYLKRSPGDYDRSLCLLSGDVIDFVIATQPKE